MQLLDRDRLDYLGDHARPVLGPLRCAAGAGVNSRAIFVLQAANWIPENSRVSGGSRPLAAMRPRARLERIAFNSKERFVSGRGSACAAGAFDRAENPIPAMRQAPVLWLAVQRDRKPQDNFWHLKVSSVPIITGTSRGNGVRSEFPNRLSGRLPLS